MDLEIFEEMDAPELKKYIEFLLWHYRVMDAFWFIYVGERFDQPTFSRPLRIEFSRRSSGCRHPLSNHSIACSRS